MHGCRKIFEHNMISNSGNTCERRCKQTKRDFTKSVEGQESQTHMVLVVILHKTYYLICLSMMPRPNALQQRKYHLDTPNWCAPLPNSRCLCLLNVTTVWAALNISSKVLLSNKEAGSHSLTLWVTIEPFSPIVINAIFLQRENYFYFHMIC